MTVEGFVVVVNNVGHVISTGFLVDGVNDKWIINLPDAIMRSLICSIVINRRPRSHRPNIIQLPVKTAHVLRLIQSQVGNCCFKSIRLHHLGIVRKTREVSCFSRVVKSISWH
jgi:hypothetical protein